MRAVLKQGIEQTPPELWFPPDERRSPAARISWRAHAAGHIRPAEPELSPTIVQKQCVTILWFQCC